METIYTCRRCSHSCKENGGKLICVGCNRVYSLTSGGVDKTVNRPVWSA